MLLNLSKFSWRSRIQGVRRPPVLATASMMRLVRWQCTVLSFLSPLFYLYIDYKMPPKPFQVPLFCPLCEVPAPVRKVTVRGLCELSIFDKWPNTQNMPKLTWDIFKGVSLHHQWGRPAHVPWTEDFSHLLQYQHSLLGLVWQKGPRECGSQHLPGSFSSSRFAKNFQHFPLCEGVHSVDFSGVRDDKCHTGVGQSRVRFRDKGNIMLFNSYWYTCIISWPCCWIPRISTGEANKVDNLPWRRIHLQWRPVHKHWAKVPCFFVCCQKWSEMEVANLADVSVQFFSPGAIFAIV